MPSDLRTRAIVLRRTNYGETDRILNLLTPEGKIAVLARGVRKEKSRLAGGIELFSVADVVIHRGHSDLGTLTSAKMLQFFGNILADLSALELAGAILKKLDRASEQVNSPEHFRLLAETLRGLNERLPSALVETWFILNLAQVSGEDINLIYDINGEKLDSKKRYYWDETESSLKEYPSGDISGNEIKFARFLLANPLAWASKVENYAELLPPLKPLVRQFH